MMQNLTNSNTKKFYAQENMLIVCVLHHGDLQIWEDLAQTVWRLHIEPTE